MRLFGMDFNTDIVARIKEVVSTQSHDNELSRSSLSRMVCQWIDWKSPNGKFREVSCRKALLELERQGQIQLPEAKPAPGAQGASKQKSTEYEFINTRFDGQISDLGQLDLIAVRGKTAESSIWNAMFSRYHPLGSGSLCGAQQRYLLHSEVLGYIGGFSFGSSAWHLKDRDNWIGWEPHARKENLNYVVGNTRFLLLPTLHVPNLASHVLKKISKRIGADWEERYGFRPVLLETFVDESRYEGTCYKAANWVRVGETSGRGRNDKHGTGSIGKKGIYLYPLQTDWREKLCHLQEKFNVLQGNYCYNDDARNWAEYEFGGVDFADGRLRNRLIQLAQDFYARPLAPVTQACNGSVAKVKAAYRFFKNKQVSMDKLLKPHIEASIHRAKQEKVVLAVQDTTSLNYKTHFAMEGLGPIRNADKVKGLKLHDTVMFTPEGVPLGVAHIKCWARGEEKRKGEEHKRLPIEEKESYRWLESYRRASEIQELCPDTRIVSVGDRESDMYELFKEAQETENGADLLVRANRNRQRKIVKDEDELGLLWDEVAKEDASGQLEIFIPAKGNRKARTAFVQVRYREVLLSPPLRVKGSKFKAWAVYAKEEEPPDSVEGLEWMLLTTVEVDGYGRACEILSWYTKRWLIEVYHRVLKSGCRIEDRRFGDASTLEGCLAIDLVVAWRITRLTYLGREVPDVSCEVFFREEEWKAMYVYLTKDPYAPDEPPTLGEAVRMVAKMGGFLGRKGDKEPGTTTLWRGLQRLDDIWEVYKMMAARLIPKDG